MAEGSPKHPLAKGSIPLPNLPEEIIREILLRLPVKALLKFRCVSKSWLSLISSPQFTRTHLEISTKNNIYSHNRLILSSGPGYNDFHTFSLNPKIDEYSLVDIVSFDFPLGDNPEAAITIVGSCNGLVCVLSFSEVYTVFLWNPSTRKLKKIPSSDGLWVQPRCGFGYDETNADYKVVQTYFIHGYPYTNETIVRVYSLRADSWRTVNWPGGGTFGDVPGVFVNGAIHWKVHFIGTSRSFDVIAMNITTETCSNLELPLYVNDHDDAYVTLGVCGGCLCASYDHHDINIDVWVMKEYGVKESWSKIFCFSCFPLDPSVFWGPEVLFVSQNGGGLLKIGRDLVMYKPSGYHEILRSGYHFEVEAATYIESLISPGF